MKRTYKLTYTIIAVFLIAIAIIIPFVGGGVQTARAVTFESYSNVIKDLQKDPNFKQSDYPEDSSDYSIYVIQVAESASGNLYVYTYQPCQKSRKLYATDINMSLSEDVNGTQLYELEVINADEIFCKYLVKGVTVSNKLVRYYNITSIYREWDKKIDGESGNNNTIDKVAFPVRNIYQVATVNGELVYDRQETYTVEIINPYADYMVYVAFAYDGIQIPGLSVVAPGLPGSILAAVKMHGIIDGHYIAFSTDMDIDRLISADVEYYYRTAEGGYNESLWFKYNDNVEYGEYVKDTVTVDEKQLFDYDKSVFGQRNHYSWDRIQTVDEFIASESTLTEETKDNLAGKQWVLRFKETPRTELENKMAWPFYTNYTTKFTEVSRVTVLRLEFETDGVVYNLGAVSDMVSGDSSPGNTIPEQEDPFWEWLANYIESVTGLSVPVKYLKIIVYALEIIACVVAVFIGGTILIIVLSVYFPPFGAFVIQALKALGSALLWLVTLPLKLFEKSDNKKE